MNFCRTSVHHMDRNGTCCSASAKCLLTHDPSQLNKMTIRQSVLTAGCAASKWSKKSYNRLKNLYLFKKRSKSSLTGNVVQTQAAAQELLEIK